MRADRLVALVLILQAHGRVTAAQVARELEISERTARRDLDALGMAGLPIYSVQGRNGGWELLGGGTTDLTGMTDGEVQALVLAAKSALVNSPDLAAAFRKLIQAVPAPFRAGAEMSAEAFIVDPVSWDRRQPESVLPAFFGVVQTSVSRGRQLAIEYSSGSRESTQRIIHPLGVASKSGRWYVMANTDVGLRTFRIDRILSADILDIPVVRPRDFDLAGAWDAMTTNVELLRTPLSIQVRVAREVMAMCESQWRGRMKVMHDNDGASPLVELRGYSAFSLAKEVVGFGATL